MFNALETVRPSNILQTFFYSIINSRVNTNFLTLPTIHPLHSVSQPNLFQIICVCFRWPQKCDRYKQLINTHFIFKKVAAVINAKIIGAI